MKTLVFVLVPYSVAPSEIMATADGLIAHHQMPDDSRAEGHFDYMVGSPGSFHDPTAEGLLPATQKRSLHRRLCSVERLPADLTPGALVTPDGTWHDQTTAEEELEWDEYYQTLLAQHPLCWVVEYLAHS